MLDKLLIFSWRSCYIAHLSLRCRQLLTGWGGNLLLFLAELLRDRAEKGSGVAVPTCPFPCAWRLLPPFGRLPRHTQTCEVDWGAWQGFRGDTVKGQTCKLGGSGDSKTKAYKIWTTVLVAEDLNTWATVLEKPWACTFNSTPLPCALTHPLKPRWWAAHFVHAVWVIYCFHNEY